MRYKHLDGIRGLASIFIVFSHIAQLYLPYLIYGNETIIHSKYENILLEFPFTIFYNGNSMIHIFFILGGFISVLSCKKIIEKSFMKKCVKRYVRLVIPILITTFIVYIILNTSGFIYNSIDSYTFNTSINAPNENMSVLNLIKYSFFDIFVYGDIFKKSVLSYNHVLWTIKIEFISSIIIYFVCRIIYNKDYLRILCFIAIIALLPNENKEFYASYFIGAIMAELIDRLKEFNKYKFIKLVTLFFGLLLLGYPYVAKSIIYRNFPNKIINNKFLGVTDIHSLAHLIGVILIVFVLLNSEQLKSFFSRKEFEFIGGLSYSIYLLHWIMLLSIVPLLLILFKGKVNYGLNLLISTVIFFAVLIPSSMLLKKVSDFVFKFTVDKLKLNK